MLALTLAGAMGLLAVLFFTPVRIPTAGGVFGMELIDVSEIPGAGPPPGWYAGPLGSAGDPGSGAALGSYSVYYGSQWGLLFQFVDAGRGSSGRWRRPTRFIAEHPLAGMLRGRVQSGKMTGARLQQLLGPPHRRSGGGRSGNEWIYEYPDWNGGFLFELDQNGKVRRMDWGHG